MPDVETGMTELTTPAADDMLHIIDASAAADPKDRRIKLSTLQATESFLGLVEIATAAEAQAGTETTKVITPATLPVIKVGGNKLQINLTGNARGTGAVDLQTARTNDDEVASGNYSGILSGQDNKVVDAHCVICGGLDNIAGSGYGDAYNAICGGQENQCLGTLGGQSFIGGGYQNIVTFNRSAIAGGYQNQIDLGFSFIGGGRNNRVRQTSGVIAGGSYNDINGHQAVIGGGYTNSASGAYSAILGGFYGVANKHGQQAHAAGRFAANGDAQTSSMVLRRVVLHNNTDWKDLYLDGVSARMTIGADTVWTFSALIVGTTQGCTKSFGFKIEGVIENDGGTTTLLGSAVTTLYDADDVSFDARALADDTNDALLIQVQDADAAGNNVRWVAKVETVEVSYAA